MVFGTTVFEKLALLQSRARGREELPLLLLPHPIGGNTQAVATSKARDAWPDLETWLHEVTVSPEGS